MSEARRADDRGEIAAEPSEDTVISFPSRTAVIADAIRDAILSGRLSAGDVLVEQDLARQYGVSKTPVREALRTLVSTGLVTVSAYKGASVRLVDNDMVRSIYEMRAILEPEALRLSVARKDEINTDLALSVLDQTVDAIERLDFVHLSLLNRTFHRIFYENCGNQILVDVLDGLRDQTALISTVGWRSHSDPTQELHEHRAILEAVESGDLDAAAALLREHIERFHQFVALAAEDGSERH